MNSNLRSIPIHSKQKLSAHESLLFFSVLRSVCEAARKNFKNELSEIDEISEEKKTDIAGLGRALPLHPPLDYEGLCSAAL